MSATVADLILKILAFHGVSHIYGVIGDAIFPLAAALARQDRIRYIPAAIENGAAYMASYAAKLSGGLGVCIGTAGPGATGLVSGTADAFLDKAPLLCLTGQIPLCELETETKQSLQPGRLYSAVTSQSHLAAHPEAVAPLLLELIQTALEKRTAVHLEVPKDILAAPAGQDFTPRITVPATYDGSGLLYGNLNDLNQAVSEAQRPLLVLGGAARPVAARLEQWARQWGAGIVLTQEAKGAIPDAAPPVMGGIGPGFLPECWPETDLILVWGAAVYERPYFPSGATVWQIDNAVNSSGPAERRIRGDFLFILAKLEECSAKQCSAKPEERSDWRAKIAAAHQARIDAVSSVGAAPPANADNLNSAAPALHPAAVAKILAGLTKSDAIITLDVGEFGQWFNFGFMAERQTILHSTSWRGMGGGIPAAVAACFQAADRQVIALVGDGGFLMSFPELSTIIRNQLPLTVIVFTNRCYGLEEHKMKKEGFPIFGTELALPDILKLVESFGIKGYRPTTLDDCGAVLQQALADPPALVEIRVSSPEMPYL